MDLIGIIFIVVLLAVSGFVAWAGDVLGRILGKRRITLFGLRPRRTSILIAVVTGMLITGGTILILALSNENVRYMLQEMGTIRTQLADLKKERTQLTDAVQNAKSDLDDARLSIDALQTSNYQISAQLSAVEEELITSLEKATELREEAAQLTEDVEEKIAQVTGLESLITGLNDDISERETRLADLNDDIISLNQQVTSLLEERALLNQQVAGLSEQVGVLEVQVEILVSGEVKVYEGQQLVVFPIDTSLDGTSIYYELLNRINLIPENYRDPISGRAVLAGNEIEISSEQYVTALEDIRAVTSQTAIVLVYATENVVENHPVPVRLDVTRNYKVYSQGTTIFSNTYDNPPEGSEQPYRAVMAQFFEDVRDFIVDEGSLIPFTSGEALQLTIDDLLALSNDLSGTEFPVELKLVALTDVYRTDFLIYDRQFTVNIESLAVSDESDDNRVFPILE